MPTRRSETAADGLNGVGRVMPHSSDNLKDDMSLFGHRKGVDGRVKPGHDASPGSSAGRLP
jgi:hypothetical protein